MSAQGIYIIKAIADEAVFDSLCETLEDFDVEIVAPSPFEYSTAATSETELVLAGSEDVLEDLKEELENMDLLESDNLVDSFEDEFGEEAEDDYLEDNF